MTMLARSFDAVFQKRTRVGKQMESLYVCRKLKNADEFIKWAKGQGFPTTLQAGDLHVTIAFSKDAVEWDDIGDSVDEIRVPSIEKLASGRSVEALGDGGAVVLRFESAELTKRWQEIKNAGAAWAHDGYAPHITITWEAGDLDLSKVEPFKGELIFGPEERKPVNEDWKKDIIEKFFLPPSKRQRTSKSFGEVFKRVGGNRIHFKVLKVETEQDEETGEELGIVFGFAMVSKVDGEDYYDFHDDHIPDDALLRASAEFMESENRTAGEMHEGFDVDILAEDGTKSQGVAIKNIGKIVFGFPLTEEIAKAMEIQSKYHGFMAGMKPYDEEVLEKFKSGEYTGFSIGGRRVKDKEVD